MELVIANVYEPSALQAANDLAGGEAEDASAVKSEKGDVTAATEQADATKANTETKK